MSTTALVNHETGEITTPVPFDVSIYVAGLGASMGAQQALSAAYDNACAQLIGPNDVQVESGRTFKKKSAWRKLARYFNISTVVRSVEHKVADGRPPEYVDTFLAIVTVAAIAPWGQTAEAVGACGTDEETGKRKITYADALATAETRATNRAVSNLIAMGEVSAEEMSKGQAAAPTQRRETAAKPAPPRSATEGPTMPFGKTKGVPLSQMAEPDLRGALEWAVSKDKFREFTAEARAELASRGPAEPADDEDPPDPEPWD